jgi:signal transduction histidine kinase
VLANLVSNAIKFSAAGSAIDLAIEQAAGKVVLRLEDCGTGRPEEAKNAFAAGHQAPSSLGSSGETGTGYGLLLAREYVEAMGGTLDLRPREGGGLTASVSLLLASILHSP